MVQFFLLLISQECFATIFEDFLLNSGSHSISIELHISNIYKREEFRHKSMISDVVTGIICGLGSNGYILAINAMQELFKNGNW